jgi:5-hydroxyisourate hydrolase-like protein (transthyretin family)
MRGMGWLGLGVILVALLWLVAPNGCTVPSDLQTTSSTDTGNDTSVDGTDEGGDASTDGGDDGTADTDGDSSSDEGAGTVTGTIVDAQTGDPLEGVQVVATSGDHLGSTDAEYSAWTGDDGQFSLSNVPAGAYTLVFTLAGYIDSEAIATIVAGGAVDVAGGLVKESEAGEEVIAMVLTWGTETTRPKDLDLHLSGPDGAGARFHVYYQSMSAGEQVSLDLDDTEWGGPETITIRRASGGDFVAGEYHVWVHNYSSTPEFGGSAALVTITAGDQQVGQYAVSVARGDPTRDIWQVVNITIDAAGNITGTDVQQVFADGWDSTVF